ncbi:hypothetical protein Ccrd_022008 [Cynara cardunculus var. scolymus]|uniref:Uncharacterized protein n=1 Tax=Cynara cardunculus var. scolymus TaxID=59895 RepID=A0A118JZL7_CYNCS|nr:hypothetical protein Ccrd_022008 [Cynara cardunculus var. scolymus]
MSPPRPPNLPSPPRPPKPPSLMPPRPPESKRLIPPLSFPNPGPPRAAISRTSAVKEFKVIKQANRCCYVMLLTVEHWNYPLEADFEQVAPQLDGSGMERTQPVFLAENQYPLSARMQPFALVEETVQDAVYAVDSNNTIHRCSRQPSLSKVQAMLDQLEHNEVPERPDLPQQPCLTEVTT